MEMIGDQIGSTPSPWASVQSLIEGGGSRTGTHCELPGLHRKISELLFYEWYTCFHMYT